MNFLLRFKRWLFVSSCCNGGNTSIAVQKSIDVSEPPSPTKLDSTSNLIKNN